MLISSKLTLTRTPFTRYLRAIQAIKRELFTRDSLHGVRVSASLLEIDMIYRVSVSLLDIDMVYGVSVSLLDIDMVYG